ncbi:MAG: cobalamin-dependent protein [Anaerolineae bacterium]|nr:cobalamin-dependent protein [Anaerolineae bacterium]
MANNINFNSYSDAPVFNIKAVTQRTGISAPTLRAWERRYNVLSPSRSDGNYRLFSERDIAILNWLNERLQSGMSISRAVALLHNSQHKHGTSNGQTNGQGQHAEFSQLQSRAGNYVSAFAVEDDAKGLNLEHLRTQLHRNLIQMDEHNAHATFAEALAVYTVEDVCQNIITPVLIQIGEDWHDGLISVTIEHFATAVLVGKFYSLFNALGTTHGPLVLVGCAPTERHEIGALMLAFLLRRRGHNVRYLGADMPINDLVESARKLKPRAIVLSAMLYESAGALSLLPPRLQAYAPDTLLFIGGNAFRNGIHPALTSSKTVNYLGNDLQEGLKSIEATLR